MNLIPYAELCNAAYNGGVGFVDVEDLRFGIERIDGQTVVAFRGSANLENWIRDLSAIPARTAKGYLAHRGFVDAFARIWPEVKKRIPASGAIVATGHSLGGALALLCAEQTGCQAVTFGCPRVYWRLSSGPILAHYRVVCDDDPVPDLPAIFFRHTCLAFETLRDADHEILNPEDHCIGVYLDRLRRFTA